MNERLRQLRKKLGLTQQEFADKLGIPRNNIAGYETGKRSPSEAAVALICREFGANEEWLRKGKGEMFAPKIETPADYLAREYGLGDDEVVLIEKFAGLRSGQRRAIIDYMTSVARELYKQ